MNSWMIAVVTGLLVSGAALAAEQSVAVEQFRDFLNAARPSLYQGHDEVGGCRLFIYSQKDASQSQVWAEGTFQNASGPVTGVPIVFMLSSKTEVSRIEALEADADSFWVTAIYPAANSDDAEVRMSLSLSKSADGALSSATYETASGKRACVDLRRIL